LLNIIGTKTEIIRTFRTEDRYFCQVLFRRLSVADNTFLDYVLYPPPALSYELQSEELSKLPSIPPLVLTRRDVKCFRNGNALEEREVNYFLHMFRYRDDRVIKANSDVNGDRTNYRPLKASCFLPWEFIEDCNAGDIAIAITLEKYRLTGNRDLALIRRIYCPVPFHVEEERLCWMLLMVDVPTRVIQLLHFHNHNRNDDHKRNAAGFALPAVNRLFSHVMMVGGHPQPPFTVVRYPYDFVAEDIAVEDCGIAVITALYFILYDCPVYFRAQDLNHMRRWWLYSLLKDGRLPI